MKVTPLSIPDVLLIEPHVFEDSRGFFFESFQSDYFKKMASLDVSFAQDNHVRSRRGVLRGIHYQLPPYAQGKLVRVIQGEVFDIALDIRRSSPTFGKHVTNILSAKNKKQIWIPEGFAHGFLTLSKNSEFLYKVTTSYKPDFERSILWNDPILNISWPTNIDIITSPRDSKSEAFSKAYIFEEL
jgi:dTDP-4-dehydrorhamnose 3,5-epimerase